MIQRNYSTDYQARVAAIHARNEETDAHGLVTIYVDGDNYTPRPEYGRHTALRRTQAELQIIAQGGPVNWYEIRERHALEHMSCFDCEIAMAKITPGEYYCPSCGDRFNE